MPTLSLHSFIGTEAGSLFPAASAIHAEVYAEPLFGGHPFFSEAAFEERFKMAVQQPHFELIIARLDGVTDVGLMYGYCLTPELGWWDQVRWNPSSLETLPDGYTDENGTRTVVIPEILVRAEHRRAGIARTMHDDFLARRKEERAGLRVLPDNQPARAAYFAWGWSVVGAVRPVPEAPTYDCMVKDLRNTRPQRPVLS